MLMSMLNIPGQCTCDHCVHACHCHAVTCCCPATRPEMDFRPWWVERKKEKKRRKSQKEEWIFVGFSLTSQCAHALTNLTDRLGFNRAAADISLSDVFNLVGLICLHWIRWCFSWLLLLFESIIFNLNQVNTPLLIVFMGESVNNFTFIHH